MGHPDDLPADFWGSHNRACPMSRNYKTTLCLCAELRKAERDAADEAAWDSRREDR